MKERDSRWVIPQRESIAWCGECGNVSVDGINFAEAGERGYLRCAACGSVGPFEYRRVAPSPSSAEEEK